LPPLPAEGAAPNVNEAPEGLATEAPKGGGSLVAPGDGPAALAPKANVGLAASFVAWLAVPAAPPKGLAVSVATPNEKDDCAALKRPLALAADPNEGVEVEEAPNGGGGLLAGVVAVPKEKGAAAGLAEAPPNWKTPALLASALVAAGAEAWPKLKPALADFTG